MRETKSSVTIMEKLRKLGVILCISISISACQNSEVQQEQLNNNSSGMDQDHTMAPPDTLSIPESRNGDTTRLANPNSTADSVQQKF